MIGNKTPSISVIIPAHNDERFIAQTIQNVLDQTFSDWEAIVVDDGSIDNTHQIVTGFTDKRISYIYQKNKGPSAARNAGIRRSQGQYLCFLDADDEWEPTFLQTCITAIGAICDPRIVGVYTECVYIDETSQILPQSSIKVVSPEQLPPRLVAGNFLAIHSVMVQSSAVHEIGLFDEDLYAVMDKDLWFRLTRRFTLLGIPKPLAKYRVYPGSLSTNAAHVHTNRMAVLQKHFGTDEGDPAQWPPDKRLAYSAGYRASALAYIAQKDIGTGWALLLKAANISPEILSEVKTYYIMACLGQPRGYRGQVEKLDIVSVGGDILHMLEEHVANAKEPIRSLYKDAKTGAYLALAQLADKSGDWSLARRYMWQGFTTSFKVAASGENIRRAAKLMAGKNLVAVLRLLRNSLPEIRRGKTKGSTI